MKSMRHIERISLLTLLLSMLVVSSVWAKKPKRDKTQNAIEAFVETKVTKTMVHVSDTLQLAYYLYSTVDVDRVVEANLPRMNDFHATALPQSAARSVERNGKTYKVYELKKMILQPKQLGERVIAEGELLLQYAIPTGERRQDFFGDVYEIVRQQRIVVKVPSTSVKVHDMKAI